MVQWDFYAFCVKMHRPQSAIDFRQCARPLTTVRAKQNFCDVLYSQRHVMKTIHGYGIIFVIKKRYNYLLIKYIIACHDTFEVFQGAIRLCYIKMKQNDARVVYCRLLHCVTLLTLLIFHENISVHNLKKLFQESWICNDKRCHHCCWRVILGQ